MPGRFLDTLCVWMERDVDGNTSVECDGGKVLIEKWFEEDDLVSMFQERHKDGVLA